MVTLSLFRGITHGYRRRSQSDCINSKSARTFTAEQLRKHKSYTAFPHIASQSKHKERTLSPSVHRSSCFRLMPHLSQGSFPDPNFSTVSVLSLSVPFENGTADIACEISSDSEESGQEQNNFEETVLHSWRRPSYRLRAYSEPVSMGISDRARSWSLPDMEEKSSQVNETIHKVKVSPSRLQFPEQPLEKLKEEITTASSMVHCSSVMSVVDRCEADFDNEVAYPQAVPDGEEPVTVHWTNRKRRQSFTKHPSLSVLTEIDNSNTELKVIVPVY